MHTQTHAPHAAHTHLHATAAHTASDNNHNDDTDGSINSNDDYNNSGNNNCDTEKPLRNIITNIHRDTRHAHPTENAPRKPAAIRTENAPKYTPKTPPNRTKNIARNEKYTRTITREVPIAPTPDKNTKTCQFSIL